MLSGNVFTQGITIAHGVTTAQHVATITVTPNTTVGGQLSYTLYTGLTASTNEAVAGLVVFSLTKATTGVLHGALYPTVTAEGGSNTGGTLTWAVDTSAANPIITAAWTAGASTTNDATLEFAVNYYGGTWGGGSFPEAT